jgi:hypothetical protein
VDEPARATKHAEEESDRRVGNLALLGIFLILVGIGAWLVFALDHARKIDDCVAQGRRNCAPIEAPR